MATKTTTAKKVSAVKKPAAPSAASKAKKPVKKTATKGMKASTAVELGAGLLAAAAAGYYFYGTKSAKKHRHAASAWAQNLKKDVVKRAKQVEKLDARVAARIVDEASKAYHGVRNVNMADVQSAAAELKKNWEMMRDEVMSTAKKVVKKPVAKKTAPAASAKKAAPRKAAPKRK